MKSGALEKPRSLRQIVLIFVGIGFLLLSGLQYYVNGNFVTRQLLEVESRYSFHRLRAMHRILDHLSEDLTITTADWAEWDETHDFASGLAPQFAAENLGSRTFDRLRLNFVLVTDNHGRVLWGRSRRGPGEPFVEVSPDIVQHVAAGGSLDGIGKADGKISGVIATAEGAYVVSAQPIGRPGTPVAGRLVMGRSLEAVARSNISQQIGQPVQVVPARVLDEVSRTPTSQQRRREREILEVRGEALDGYTPIDDLDGKTAAVLAATYERPMNATLADTQRHLFISTLVLGLLFCVAGLAFIERKVAAPLARMAGAVAGIGAGGSAAARVDEATGNAELATLGTSINRMLEQLEQQQAMRRDRDAAIEANRLKSEFLATMSHEIRTPMNGVLGMCELLQRTELNPRQRHLSDTLLRSARSLLDILNDILDFSRIESGRLQLEAAEFSPCEVVQSLSAPFHASAQAKGLAFNVSFDSNVPAQVIGDSLRLRQVLNNLISNAIKFTERGSINVACTSRFLNDDCVELHFVIDDTGIGISASAQQRIFEPFTQAESQTSRHYGGSGLGLAIVRRLVELMGGTVALDSEPGRGSRFSFTVMMRAVADQSATSAAIEMATGPRFSIADAPNVLVAEDNAVNREVITEMLEHIGCRVTAVENGAQAVAAAADGSYAVILMDCQMPVMDGQTAAAELRTLENSALRTPAFIVALTADATNENRQRCLAAGMNAIALKPIAQARLRELIFKGVRPARSAIA